MADINVLGKLKSICSDGILADSNQVYDNNHKDTLDNIVNKLDIGYVSLSDITSSIVSNTVSQTLDDATINIFKSHNIIIVNDYKYIFINQSTNNNEFYGYYYSPIDKFISININYTTKKIIYTHFNTGEFDTDFNKMKASYITLDGDGTKYLNDKGEYTTISTSSDGIKIYTPTDEEFSLPNNNTDGTCTQEFLDMLIANKPILVIQSFFCYPMTFNNSNIVYISSYQNIQPATIYQIIINCKTRAVQSILQDMTSFINTNLDGSDISEDFPVKAKTISDKFKEIEAKIASSSSSGDINVVTPTDEELVKTGETSDDSSYCISGTISDDFIAKIKEKPIINLNNSSLQNGYFYPIIVDANSAYYGTFYLHVVGSTTGYLNFDFTEKTFTLAIKQPDENKYVPIITATTTNNQISNITTSSDNGAYTISAKLSDDFISIIKKKKPIIDGTDLFEIGYFYPIAISDENAYFGNLYNHIVGTHYSFMNIDFTNKTLEITYEEPGSTDSKGLNVVEFNYNKFTSSGSGDDIELKYTPTTDEYNKLIKADAIDIKLNGYVFTRCYLSYISNDLTNAVNYDTYYFTSNNSMVDKSYIVRICKVEVLMYIKS